MKVFNEIGFDLDNGFMSYEIESEMGEVRIRGWYKGKVKRFYIRLWLGKKVLIWSKGFKVVNKNRNNIKFVIGFEMEV